MRAIDFLEVIGETPDVYVLDAAQAKEAGLRNPARKRIWLIAAIVAVMLMLVGCAVVYMLRMQDLTVGKWQEDISIIFDENGNQIPIETREPTILLSQQNVNMEALTEWLAFTDTYDPDGTIMTEADKAMKSGNPWEIPKNYHYTYGCYSQEMVDKLDEIVAKYDLKLLSAMETFMYYQSEAMLNCMGLDSLTHNPADVKYWGGYLFPEGTLIMDMELDMKMDGWATREGNIGRYRYSVKDYFDPYTSGMQASQEYAQWDYTCQDGTAVLLILNESTARIYADLPDAFISISVDPVILVDGQEVPMTREALEQTAEIFDLSAKPQPVTLENVRKHLEESQAAFDAEKEQQKAHHEAQYAAGYEEYVDYLLENNPISDRLSYVLYDINGDGIQELIIDGLDILSMKDGESYKYFKLADTGVVPAQFYPCEGNVFAVSSESVYFNEHRYFFYRANADSAEFITGVTHETHTDTWYQNLTDGLDTQQKEITAEEAQKILDSYTYIDFNWLPLKKYGEPVKSITYTDPYARYIANKLERYDNAVNFKYTLMDLNGDGIEELLAWDVETETGDTSYLSLSIHTVRDGKIHSLNNYGMGMAVYVCEGGILEESYDFLDNGDARTYYAYYQVTQESLELIERVALDPFYQYWGHVVAGQEVEYISEEKAQSIIQSYKRMDLDMKPFTEYPFQ